MPYKKTQSLTTRSVGKFSSKESLYIITEGSTEWDYITNLRNGHKFSKGVRPARIDKDGLDVNETNRKNMVFIAFDFIRQKLRGITNYRRCIKLVLDDFYVTFIRSDLAMSFDDFPKTLRKFREELIDQYKDLSLIDSVPDSFSHEIERKCRERFNVQYTMSDPSVLKAEYHDDVRQRTFVLFDRDDS